MTDEHHVGLSVSDEAKGIPLDARERVFEVLPRARSRIHDPRRKGIGLGLPIVRRLVAAQAGRIWFDSPPFGSGTPAQLTVPVSVTPAATLDAVLPATPAAVSLMVN